MTDALRPAVVERPERAGASILERLRVGAGRVSVTDGVAATVVLGEWSGIARAAIGAPIYAAVLDVVLVALALVVGVGALRSGTWRRLGLTGALVATYVALAAIEIFNPNVPGLRAGLEGFRKTAFTAIAFGIVALSTTGDPSRFFRIVAIGSVPAFLMGIRQFFAPFPLELQIIQTSGISRLTFESDAALRAFSPTAGPFHLGVLAGCAMVISLVAARRGSRVWLVLAMLAAVALGLTLTRANLAASFFAAAVVAIVAGPGRARLQNLGRVVPPAAAAALAILLAAGALGYTPAKAPTSTGAIPSTRPGDTPPTIGEVVGGVVNPLADKNLQFRFQFWGEFLEAFAERPIVGYGTSAAADGFKHFYADPARHYFQPHSLYFKAALEGGIVGLLVLLGILAVFARLALKRAIRGDEVGLFGIGILTIFLVSGLTAPMLDAYPANVLFWATFAWCLRSSMRTPATPSPSP